MRVVVPTAALLLTLSTGVRADRLHELTSRSPAAKRQEVIETVKRWGLDPTKLHVRIFHSRLLPVMQRNGTDRVGIDQAQVPYAPGEVMGYHNVLRQQGLRSEDGTYALPLTEFMEVMGGAFKSSILGHAPFRQAIAIYRSDALTAVPPKHGEVGEFFRFKQPAKKGEALVGVLVQPPTRLDALFAGSDMDRKLEILDRLSRKAEKPTSSTYAEEFAADLRHELALEMGRTGEHADRQRLEEKLGRVERSLEQVNAGRARRARVDGLERTLELARQRPGMRRNSVEFVLKEVQKAHGYPPAYQRKLDRLRQMALELLQ